MKFLKSIFKKKEQIVFYIGGMPLDAASLETQGVSSIHFKTTAFIKDDDILSMWDRITRLVAEKKPNIIIVKMDIPDLMNENEENFLRKFGVVIKIPNG